MTSSSADGNTAVVNLSERQFATYAGAVQFPTQRGWSGNETGIPTCTHQDILLLRFPKFESPLQSQYLCMHICIFLYVYMYACVYVRMCVCMYVCMHTCISRLPTPSHWVYNEEGLKAVTVLCGLSQSVQDLVVVLSTIHLVSDSPG